MPGPTDTAILAQRIGLCTRPGRRWAVPPGAALVACRRQMECRPPPGLACRRRAGGRSGTLQRLEVVLVEALEHVGLLVVHAHVVEDHQPGELATVNQDDALAQEPGVLHRITAVGAGGDEHTAVSLLTVQGTDERLDRRPPDRVVLGIPLGLQVDAVQTQGVLPDDSVDAAVADLAGVLDGARAAAVAHRRQNLQYEALEGGWVKSPQAVQELGLHTGTVLSLRSSHQVLGSLLSLVGVVCGFGRALGRVLRVGPGPAPRPELQVGGVPVEVARVDALGLLTQGGPAGGLS